MAAWLAAAAPAFAQNAMASSPPPKVASPQDAAILKNVRLDQKLNANVPLDLPFKDESGRDVKLGDYFRAQPVMLVLIQYRCTMLCNDEMNVLLESLKQMSFTPGKEFNLLIATIDPREDPDMAAEKKRHYLEAYGRPEAAAGWHFLTGPQTSIEQLAEAVGFHYAYDGRTDQYAHPDGVILLTPQGKVARYFFRLEYPARDLRLGLVEAASGKIGTPLDAIALLCFHYNPVTGKYALAYMSVLRLAGIATVVLIVVGILVMRIQELRKRRFTNAAPAGGSG
jgi:protein SCO1/2